MSKYLLVIFLFTASALAAVPRKSRIDPNLNWRIIGGKDAEDGAHPHQVSLEFFGYHFCGGSIVHEEWVVTTALCAHGLSENYMTIAVGSNKLSKPADIYKVLKVFVHNEYDPWNLQNDVAILQTEKISFNEKVRPIAVETEDVGGDQPCTLSGWGSTHPSEGGTSDNLQDVDLKTTTFEYCKESHTTPIFDSQICTSTVSGEGACHGDGGGPLIHQSNNGRGDVSLIGLFSWGLPCATGFPDVYSKAPAFFEWFNEQCGDCLNKY